VKTIDRSELWAKIERGDRFRLVMALNYWAFRAKHIPGSEHFNTPEELFSSLKPDEEAVFGRVDRLGSRRPALGVRLDLKNDGRIARSAL